MILEYPGGGRGVYKVRGKSVKEQEVGGMKVRQNREEDEEE